MQILITIFRYNDSKESRMKTFKLLRILALFLLIPIIFIFVDKNDHKQNITIAVGGTDGAYATYAKAYQKYFKKEGVTVKIINTQGSLEIQSYLLKDKADFGFVQGGTERTNQGLYALANVAYEPIWMFYHDKHITNISDLKGKNIAVGDKKSGIYPVTKTLLSTNGIDEDNTHFYHFSNQEAIQQLQNKQIDALFYIASYPSKLVQSLLTTDNIYLHNFQNAAAYKQYFLKNKNYFQILHLEAKSVDFLRNIPKKPITLLAKTTSFITKNASDEMVRLMLKVIEKVHKKPMLFHDESTFPNTQNLKIKQHPAALRYFEEKEYFYERTFSYWTAQSLDKVSNFFVLYLLPILTIFAFYVEVIKPTIDWYSRRNIVKWYDKVNALDTGIDLLTKKEAMGKKIELNQLLYNIRDIEDIDPIHMEEFYALQNQIVNIINALERHIALS